jgi:hypothetical protein
MFQRLVLKAARDFILCPVEYKWPPLSVGLTNLKEKEMISSFGHIG